jgi:HK97 family phage prohead protease
MVGGAMPRTLTGTDEEKHVGTALTIKAAGDDAPAGSFEALAAVFGNVDLDGDRMVKGAFARTLDERGFPAVVWAHQKTIPPIGEVASAEETDAGLVIKGRLFVADDEDHLVARQVWAGLKSQGGDGRPALRDFSFAMRVKSARWVEEDPDTLPPDLQWTGGEIREITDADLWEIGPCLVGANPQAGLLSAKSIGALASRLGVSKSDVESALRSTSKSDDAPADTAPADDDDAPAFTDRQHATRLAELIATTNHLSEE